METKIPGLKAKHAIITPECRVNRGDTGAIHEALSRVLDEYKAILKARSDKPTFHLVLTVEEQHGSHGAISFAPIRRAGCDIFDEIRCLNSEEKMFEKWWKSNDHFLPYCSSVPESRFREIAWSAWQAGRSKQYEGSHEV